MVKNQDLPFIKILRILGLEARTISTISKKFYEFYCSEGGAGLEAHRSFLPVGDGGRRERARARWGGKF